MKKWNLVVDVARCNNCACCQLATMDEYARNEFPAYSAAAPKGGAPWVRIDRFDRGRGEHVDVAYVPRMCFHCDEAPCGAGRDEAFIKRSDGIVLLPPERVQGRKDLVDKCPYGAIHWNEERQVPQLWGFDAHLLDNGWSEPRASHACPTKAMQAHRVTDDEMNLKIARERLAIWPSDVRSFPRVYYRNLARALSRFVAGTLQGEMGGRLECLQGASVELWRDQRLFKSATSDTFGDFKLDGLPATDTDYELRIAARGFVPTSMPVRVVEAGMVLDTIKMPRTTKAIDVCT